METTTRQFIIGMLIFTGLITGCFTIISLALPKSSDTFTYTNTTLSRFADVENNANTMSNSIENSQASGGKVTILETLISFGISALSSIWSSVTTFGQIIPSMITILGLPNWFSGMLIAIIGIIVAFSLMAAWFKWWL